jgi:hypothetical protein
LEKRVEHLTQELHLARLESTPLQNTNQLTPQGIASPPFVSDLTEFPEGGAIANPLQYVHLQDDNLVFSAGQTSTGKEEYQDERGVG